MADATQRELNYRKRLIEIANHDQLGLEHPGRSSWTCKDKMLDLVDAERVTIFALDTKNQELFSLFKAGQEVQARSASRRPSPRSRASRRCHARRANIKNAYDAAELAQAPPEPAVRLALGQGLRLQDRCRSSRRPILFEKYLLGVLQLVNKRGGAAFTPKDEEAAEELGKILGIAFYNQHRAARTNKPSKFGALVDKGLVSEKDVEKAVSSARVNQIDVAKILIEELHVAKEEIARGTRASSTTAPPGKAARTIPEELKQRVSADFLKKNVCAPLEKTRRHR